MCSFNQELEIFFQKKKFPPLCLPPKVKKFDLRGQKRSMQWKDAKDVLVKQKQLGELP